MDSSPPRSGLPLPTRLRKAVFGAVVRCALARIEIAITFTSATFKFWHSVSQAIGWLKKRHGVKPQEDATIRSFCWSVIVGVLLAAALNADAQTINVDIQTTSDPVYSGSDGVLSTSGSYWNNSATEAVNLKDEFGVGTAVDLILRQWLGSITWSGSHALFGEGLSAAWSSPVIYDVSDLDPYKMYDVVLYFQASAKANVYLYDEGRMQNRKTTIYNGRTLPGTDGAEYLRFSGLKPYELSAGVYGVKFYVYSQSSSIYEAIVGLQIKNTDSRSNIPPLMPSLLSPINSSAGVSVDAALTASVFSDPDGGDTHANSRWQVDNNSTFASPEWDSGDTYAATTFASVPAGVLAPATTYYWRVRYKDSAGNWSPYSLPFSFTTASAATSYTVTFDAQGGTVPVPASTSVTSGSTYGALATTTRANYTFGGWWTGTDGTGTEVTFATTVTITAAQTLYAKWTATTTSQGTPHWWLDQYGLVTGGDYEAADVADTDGDGQAAWQEYIGGSVPTDRESVFRSLIAVSNGVPLVTWTPDLGTARVYTVEGRTNLTEGAWGTTNAGSRFFRVQVGSP